MTEATETRAAPAPLPLLDLDEFRDRVVLPYNRGAGDKELPADLATATSITPAGTGAFRDFSYIAPEIPVFDPDRCVGCMLCVAECPDTAILARVAEPDALEQRLTTVPDGEQREHLRGQWVRTSKYWDAFDKKGEQGGLFGIFIDPTKCKGCGECVEVCGVHDALHMRQKAPGTVERYRDDFQFFLRMPETPERFVNERSLVDIMLVHRSLLYVGGAGSCMGCGEATAIRMLLAATGFVYGTEGVGIVASTGCNTVYGSTYPYNPYTVPWTNSLFENGPTDAMGIRARWDQAGWKDKRLWVIGGDGAMLDIGFGSLSRMLASGMDIKVLVLDTQVYSNTGGQASTASFMAQDSKLASFGQLHHGKRENRKELGLIAMMHPSVYVAQTVTSDPNHFYKAIMGANEFPGPAVVNVYATCQPEHGVGDNAAQQQSRLAKDSRTFPAFLYDPRKGAGIAERLSLTGNPAMRDDWWTNPKTGEPLTFIDFARTEGRFAKHFDEGGNPSVELRRAEQERLQYWRMLQELAGLR